MNMQPTTLEKNEILIGQFLENAQPAKLNVHELIAGRLVIQGTSGAGKSWTLRRILEQSHGMIQQIIFDPEGEFSGFADHFGISRVELYDIAPDLLAGLAKKIRQHRISVVFDFQGMDILDQMTAASTLLNTFVQETKEHWHPALVAIDEAQLFAPAAAGRGSGTSIRKDSIAAMAELASRGRKRGLASILATTRLAKVNASVTSECSNALIGRNHHQMDIQRAANLLGIHIGRAECLADLLPGQFMAIGPAVSSLANQVKIAAVETFHDGATPDLEALPQVDATAINGILDLGSLKGTAKQAKSEEVQGRGSRNHTKTLGAFLINNTSPISAAIMVQLGQISPNAARTDDLSKALRIDTEKLTEALSLLEYHKLIEKRSNEKMTVVRLAPSIRRLNTLPNVADLAPEKSDE